MIKLVRCFTGELCDEAGDCSENEVTSVEYVRYRRDSRYAIGRLKQAVHGVYRLYGGSDRLKGRFVFSDRV